MRRGREQKLETLDERARNRARDARESTGQAPNRAPTRVGRRDTPRFPEPLALRVARGQDGHYI
jgi:hypothetical protein